MFVVCSYCSLLFVFVFLLDMCCSLLFGAVNVGWRLSFSVVVVRCSLVLAGAVGAVWYRCLLFGVLLLCVVSVCRC